MSGGILLSKRRTIWERDGRMCHYCGTPLDLDNSTADHVWPKSRGGVDANWNLVTACAPCNTALDNRTDKCACAFCDEARQRSQHTRRNIHPMATVAALAGWRRTADGWERVNATADP